MIFSVIRVCWDFSYIFFFFLVYRITLLLIHIQFIPRRLSWAYFSFLISLKEWRSWEKSIHFREFNNQMIIVGKEQLEYECSWTWGSLIQLWFYIYRFSWDIALGRKQNQFQFVFYLCVFPLVHLKVVIIQLVHILLWNEWAKNSN